MAEVQVLHRPVFTEAEAARILRLPQSTLHGWLDGRTVRGKSYPPIIRVEPTNSREVTWGEFVEAGLLRQYRRELVVPFRELRAFVDRVRQEIGDPYPLASCRPFVGEGPRLLEQAQSEAGLDPAFCLVGEANGQLVLLPAADAYVQRVIWGPDEAAMGWRPHADLQSPVLMDPEIRAGRPAVKGISTEALWEQVDTGATLEEVAESFGLTVRDVEWACGYEWSGRAA